MSSFIQIKDYDASIHREILDALVREDESLIEICEDRAIEEMKGYLSSRYDCEAIFKATGKKRNQLIMMFALDISVYHIFCIHNPQKLSKMRENRYNRAVEWLKSVRKGDISVDGLPELELEKKLEESPYQIISNRKRVTER